MCLACLGLRVQVEDSWDRRTHARLATATRISAGKTRGHESGPTRGGGAQRGDSMCWEGRRRLLEVAETTLKGYRW